MALTERYCTNAGAGAHDGTSEANAWSITEAATNVAAGMRLNIKGAITPAAAVTFANGTTGAPIVLRGYNAAPGDITPTRTLGGGGPLDTTIHPLVTTTAGNFTVGTYSVVESLAFAANRASFTFTCGAETMLKGCSFLNTNAGATASAFTCGNSRVLMVDSDFTAGCVLSTTAGVINLTGSAMRMVRCRIRATNNAHLVRHSAVSPFYVLFCQFLNTTAAALYFQNQGALSGGIIMGNTCYNVGDFVQTPNTATNQIGGTLFDSNHVTDGTNFINNLLATPTTLLFRMNNRLRDVAEGVNLGDPPYWNRVDADTGGHATDYVDAPGGDLRLITAAPGRNAGARPQTDIGAVQHVDPAGSTEHSHVFLG